MATSQPDDWKIRRVTAQNRTRLYKRIGVMEWVLNDPGFDMTGVELTIPVKKECGEWEKVTIKSVSKECAEAIRKSLEIELQSCQREAGCNIDGMSITLESLRDQLLECANEHGLDVSKKREWKLSTLLKHIAENTPEENPGDVISVDDMLKELEDEQPEANDNQQPSQGISGMTDSMWKQAKNLSAKTFRWQDVYHHTVCAGPAGEPQPNTRFCVCVGFKGDDDTVFGPRFFEVGFPLELSLDGGILELPSGLSLVVIQALRGGDDYRRNRYQLAVSIRRRSHSELTSVFANQNEADDVVNALLKAGFKEFRFGNMSL